MSEADTLKRQWTREELLTFPSGRIILHGFESARCTCEPLVVQALQVIGPHLDFKCACGCEVWVWHGPYGATATVREGHS